MLNYAVFHFLCVLLSVSLFSYSCSFLLSVVNITPILFSYSLSHGLSIFQEGKGGGKDTIKLEANAETSKVSILVVISE